MGIGPSAPLEQIPKIGCSSCPAVWVSFYFEQKELLSPSFRSVTPITFFHIPSPYLRVDIFTGFSVCC